jgi:hypothetical protein
MRLILAVLLTVLIGCASAEAATLHVAPGGTGNCTSASPCGSFGVAEATAQPGDVVEVRDGTYGHQTLVVNRAAGPAVVFREAAGARVILGGLSVDGADWLTFNGFETSTQAVGD